MLSVFAASEMQVSALTGVRAAGFHFTLDRLSGEMIETLRAHRESAADGEFDHALDAAPDPTSPGGALAAAWRARAVAAIPDASTAIVCADDFCDLELVWSEEIDGTPRRQSFNTGTPL